MPRFPEPLAAALASHSHPGLSLHLPLHSRGRGLPPSLRQLLRRGAGQWDLPELPAIGGPLEAEGAVAEAQRHLADSWGAQRSWFGVNGASGLLQAALLGALRPGQRLLCPRNLHRSVLHGLVLHDLEPVLFSPPFEPHSDLWLPPTPALMKQLLEAAGEVDLVLLVSPTYQGHAAPLAALIRLCHGRGIPVLVDEAHGAHFRGSTSLPLDALAAGADLVVQSTHKSLPGLGQGALLHLQGPRVDPERLERGLALLQTSSPSSLLMASSALASAWLHGAAGQRALRRGLDQARAWAEQLRRQGWRLSRNDDPLRLRIETRGLQRNGLLLDAALQSLGVVGELPEPTAITFCLGWQPQRCGARHLSHALRAACDAVPAVPLPAAEQPPLPLLGRLETELRQAWYGPRRHLPLQACLNRVIAEVISPYPPGIPLLLPGERLDAARLDWLQRQAQLWPGRIGQRLWVLEG